MNIAPCILRDTNHPADANGDGGNHRDAQLVELVNAAGFGISDITRDIKTTKWSRWTNGLRFLAKHNMPSMFMYRTAGFCGLQYQIYQHAFTQHSGNRLLMWESTLNFFPAYLGKSFGFKVLAMPQNLESLVATHPFTGSSLPKSFVHEIAYLSRADGVFCISREEQWLLRLFNIDADFLPYYPSKLVLSNLLKIREARKHSAKQRFLVLGTALNPPTREGMIEQLRWLTQISKEMPIEIDIAGYGTETLEGYVDNPNFTLHGAVTPQKLNDLLINAKAMLAHQTAGAGALCRIPEMIIGGIPVIGNSSACRSTSGYPGVYCYDDRLGLADLMSRHLEVPSMLSRPIEAEQRFINCLRQLAQ